MRSYDGMSMVRIGTSSLAVAGLIVMISTTGCAFVGSPDVPGASSDDDNGAEHRRWDWNTNGHGDGVVDAPPSDYFFFLEDGGSLLFDGVLFTDGYVDSVDQFHVDGLHEGYVTPVLANTDEVIAGLVGLDGDFLDLYWDPSDSDRLLFRNTDVRPAYP